MNWPRQLRAVSAILGVATAAGAQAQCPVSFSDPIDVPAGLGRTSVAIGRFNSDSLPDLAVCGGNTPTVAVFIASGPGSFLPPVSYPVGPGPFQVVVTDVNSD